MAEGDYTSVTRYAGYIEEKHREYLNTGWAYCGLTYLDSPYRSYDTFGAEDGFFSTGYEIGTMFALFDEFGRFMSGLDISSFWDGFFKDIINSDVDDAADKEKDIKDDTLIADTLPTHYLSYRDLNAVCSSSFVIGAANIEDNRLKEIEKRKINIQCSLIPEVQKKLANFANFDKHRVTTYALALKKYYQMEMASKGRCMAWSYKDKLWPLYVVDYMTKALSTLERAANIKHEIVKTRSEMSRFFSMASDAVTGLFVGLMVGGWQGAIVGVIVGSRVGIAKMLIESGRTDLLIYNFASPVSLFGLGYED